MKLYQVIIALIAGGLAVYFELRHKTSASLLPLFICAVYVTFILWQLDNSPSGFQATTYDIGSDGGFVLDFKKNGHLKAERREHWSVTYYWGRYTKKGDTVEMDISLDFPVGRQALQTDTSFHIPGSNLSFQIF